MGHFQQIPLLRFIIPLIFGVMIGNNIIVNTYFIFGLLILVLTPTFIYYFFKLSNENRAYQSRWVFGFFLTLSIFTSGILLSSGHSNLLKKNHFSNIDFHGNTCIVNVVEAPSERSRSVRLLVKVEAIKQAEGWITTTGKALLYLEKDSAALQLNYGDKLLINANFSETNPPSNPYEFDYKRYLAFNNIYHQAYKKSNTWSLLERDKGHFIYNAGYKTRDLMLRQLEKFGIEGKNYALVSALLLGMKDALDSDMLKEFSAAGAMHVLCVSGLHVGIIFLVLNFAFSFLEKTKRFKFLKPVLVIGFIWFYALITGLSPSVMRAAAMFSIITIGKAFNRNTCIYNSISASAIFLIIINPYIITKLGFWLSYLAVIGIVYLYPKFYKILKVKNKFGDKLWALVCVSLSAQIATAPLAVYFFNQFPNYFLLSNILVVPLATLIVYSGIALIIFSFIPMVSDIMAWVLSWELNILRWYVNFIDNLPFSTSTFVITHTQMLLIYGAIIIFILYFVKQKPVLLKSGLAGLILVFLISGINSINAKNQNMFIIYSLNKGLGIDFIDGHNAIFMAEPQIHNDEALIAYHISNFRLKKGLKKITPIDIQSLTKNNDTLIGNKLFYRNNKLVFGNTKIVIIDRSAPKAIHKQSLNSELLVFTGLPYGRDYAYLDNYKSEHYVIHNRLRAFEAEAIMNYLENAETYDMKKSGAFIKNLR